MSENICRLITLPLSTLHRLRGLGIAVWLAASTSSLPAAKTPVGTASLQTNHVLLVMADGVRWQEVFTGAEERLISKEFGGVTKTNEVRKAFWRDTPTARRAALMPFFWNTLAKEGQLYGNQHKGSIAHVTNGKNFSYPGYSEILTGIVDPRIDSNAKKPNPNVTVLEWFQQKPAFRGRIAAFGNWDVIPYIINRERSGVPIWTGFEKSDPLKSPFLASLEKLIADHTPTWGTMMTYDTFIHSAALQHLKTHKPRLMYVCYGEPDEWAHEGRYDYYLQSIHHFDRFVGELWSAAQADTEMRGRTSLLLITDHGRGTNNVSWKNHAQNIQGSGFIWVGALGPDTPALGERTNVAAVTQNQIAATASALLGEDYRAVFPKAGAPIADVFPKVTTQRIDFIRDIQPIFSTHCVSCHGPAKQKNGYRVDVKAVALKGGDTHGTAVVPGKSAESPLIQYVSGLVEDMLMPPKGERLTPAQIGLLRAWIDQGAVWPDAASVKIENPLDWWSLKPLTKPAPPVIAGALPIDAFITTKLAQKGLAMSPEADARTLVRRLYFNLTGLPPTPEATDAFVADKSADKYERLVDKLLASPAYGERWARHWLDVVHYGDTHGYDKDQPRPNAWPYRDYVIRALNEDKPYTQFVQEQLAGDVLFPGTKDGIEALGFISAGPWDLIGHMEVSESKIDGKIARHLDRDDMVGNAMGTFTSFTAQCAQCHNHKFDPITQADYYSLQAVFAAVDRADKRYDLDPAVAVRRVELAKRKTELEEKEKAFASDLLKAAGPEFAKLEKEIAAEEKAASQGVRPEYGWHSRIETKQETRKWVQVDLGKSVTLDRVVLAGVWDDFNGIGGGFGFPVRFRIEASDDAEFGGVPVVIAANDLEDVLNPGTAPQTFSATGKSGRYIRVTATKLAPRQEDYIFALSELQVFDTAGKNAALAAPATSIDSIEAPVRWRRKNLTDDIYPAKTGGGDKIAGLRKQRDSRLAEVLDEPARAARTANKVSLEATVKELAQLPAQRVVYAGTAHSGSGNFAGTKGKPRVIRLLARGQVTTPRDEVQPAALKVLDGTVPATFNLAPTAPEGERRAALAKWITAPAHPLTWRSIVNRVWQYHFGHGIVDTPGDFGRMGTPPTHPELLDWLAVTFRDDMGGSLKKLHKLMVMSAAYRQVSSTKNDKAEAIDSGNRLLWRANSRKLEAEALRDAVLAVSGKLDLKQGGPGWQDFVVQRPEHSPHYEYGLADPNDARTWRRSIYRFIVRSQMQPFMTSLDCADPSMRVPKRNESVSPTQALALLNNGFMVTQAAHFAERVKAEAGADIAAQIERACRLAIGRAPSPEEKAQLISFAQKRGMPNACRVLLNLNAFTFID